MSTELIPVVAPNNRAVHFTVFSGGLQRGRCVQLTQAITAGNEHAPFNAIQFTQGQALEAAIRLLQFVNETAAVRSDM